MNKELTIVPPEGFEVDKEKSTFEKIVFKPTNTKPRSWEEYLKRNNHPNQQYAINDDGLIIKTFASGCAGNLHYVSQRMKRYLPTKEYAEAFLALMQLVSLRQAWIGDWMPNWNKCSTSKKYVIEVWNNNLEVNSYVNNNSPLSFPTREMAQDFLICFKDLIEQAKSLI